MQLLVGIVAGVLAAGALLVEPGVEARGDEAVGALLMLRSPGREEVCILVLGMLGVPAHPAPLHVVRLGGLLELLPQLEVLDCAALAAPAARLPILQPLVHALHQVLRVGHVAHARVLPLAADPFQRRDRAGERHLVVGRLWSALVEIPPRHAVTRRRLHQGGVATGAGFGGIVSDGALVGVNQYGDRARHGCTTTGMSVCRRISSACDTVTLLVRPVRVTCAPANSASHLVRSTTRATTSPGVPGSMCVTKATPWSDSTASASPTTCTPAA